MSKLVKVKVTKDGSGNHLGANLTLDINQLLALFPEERRAKEQKQVTFVVLRNITLMRKLFAFYCAVGNLNATGGGNRSDEKMSRFQLWRFLKDGRVHHHRPAFNLAAIDRVLCELWPVEKPHSPTDKFTINQFLKFCVAIAYHLYKDELRAEDTGNGVLCECLQRLLDDHLMNHSFVVGGQFLFDARRSMKALIYMESSWRVFQYCRQTYASDSRRLPTMRHLLFMLRDFDVLGRHLSTHTVVSVLSIDDPFVVSHPPATTYNTEMEITFLEFFEALVGCALCYGFDNMRLMRRAGVSSSSSAGIAAESAMVGERAHDDFFVWSKQVQNFFTKVLFPAWQNGQKIARATQSARVRESVMQNA